MVTPVIQDDAAPSYDYIIVGGGTSGCVLANRLTEDPQVSVVLLEAGQNHNSDERVYTPGLLVDLLDSELDWQYVSQPQPGINGRPMKQPRGKLIGGTSAINSFALIYPSKAGIDIWAELGNEGWDWDGLKEYFRKFQTVNEPDETTRKNLNIKSHDTTSGPLQASYTFQPKQQHQTAWSKAYLSIQKAWVDAFRSINLENEQDPLDGDALGGYASTCHISDQKRERSHAGVAFLEPASSRPNLTIISGAHVDKLLFNTQCGKDAVATGVSYLDANGTKSHVNASREVILAAGAFASPQLLELSGIGTPDVLQKHGIDILYPNANVGENLQDHIRGGLSFELKEPKIVIPNDEARKLYEETRTGPWAENSAFAFAYMPLDPFLLEEEKRDLAKLVDKHLEEPGLTDFEKKRNGFIREMLFSPTEATATTFVSGKLAGPYSDDQKRPWMSFFSMLSHPFSRGSSHITSPDVAVLPSIDMGYYTHPLDLEIHAQHVRVLEKLASAEPFSSFFKADGDRLPPTAQGGVKIEPAKDALKQYATTNYHPCGTCSMLPEDMGGVVDSRLRVYGTTNVRVVDASVMPIIPRGNIVTAVYAVAEKAADLVKEDWSKGGKMAMSL